jgi:hypothetical protein
MGQAHLLGHETVQIPGKFVQILQLLLATPKACQRNPMSMSGQSLDEVIGPRTNPVRGVRHDEEYLQW